MLVPPVSVLLVPSDGNAALGGEKRKKVLWNQVVFDVLEIFYLEVLKAKGMEKKIGMVLYTENGEESVRVLLEESCSL